MSGGLRGGLTHREVASPGRRYWPAVVHVDPPLLDDGTIDVRALCRQWDDEVNHPSQPERRETTT